MTPQEKNDLLNELRKEYIEVKKKEDKISLLVEATHNSSTRSRKILILLIFSSIVAFSAYWNSRPSGWPNQRFEMINKIYENCLLNKSSDSLASKYLTINNKPLIEKCSSKDSANIYSFLDKRNINTVNEIEFVKKVYYDLKEETYSVKIPIIGVNFDINDLGLFTGISLSLLLFILWFCLEREWENLYLTFKEAKKIDLKYYYKIISMNQVFTVPAKENRQHNFLWIIIPKLLYLIPLIVQSLICINDLATSSTVSPISETATTTYNIANIISILSIFVLSLICIIYTIKIDLVWNHYHKKIHHD